MAIGLKQGLQLKLAPTGIWMLVAASNHVYVAPPVAVSCVVWDSQIVSSIPANGWSKTVISKTKDWVPLIGQASFLSHPRFQ